VLDLGASDRPGATDASADPAVALLDTLAGPPPARTGAGRAPRPGAPTAPGSPARSTGPADGGSPLGRAAAEIRRRVAEGEVPVGLNRLSEVLAPPVAGPPAPRRPLGDPDAVVEVVRRYPFAALDAPDPDAVARCLTAVLGDGKRVVVTGVDPAQLAAVRAALPDSLRGLCLDGPIPLSEPEIRELRWLMATETDERRDRYDQVMPEPELVPPVERIAELCRSAGRKGYPARDGADLIPELLGGLSRTRLTGLISTAQRCLDALGRISRNDGQDASWARPLLERVLFGTARPDFELLLRRTGEVVSSADKLNAATDRMGVIGDLPSDAIPQLRAYADYLDSGGKARAYFRSPRQRAVEPTLRHLQLDGAPMKDSTVLRQAISFLQLVRSMDELSGDCARIGVPAPVDVPGVAGLNRRLTLIRDAGLATEDLRHEVLFIHPDSPVSMPDLSTTQRIASLIASSGGIDEMETARSELSRLADDLARSINQVRAPHRAAPEARAALEALRAMSVPLYLDAESDLRAARRQHADQRRLNTLMDRLRAGAPGLAEAWQHPAAPTFGSGTARFVPLPRLLSELPEADTADLVLLLGADRLSTAHLLAASAAPRLLAVGAGFTSGPLPAVAPGLRSLSAPTETVLSALRRAGVPVVVGEQSSGAHAAGAPGAPGGAPGAAPAGSGPAGSGPAGSGGPGLAGSGAGPARPAGAGPAGSGAAPGGPGAAPAGPSGPGSAAGGPGSAAGGPGSAAGGPGAVPGRQAGPVAPHPPAGAPAAPAAAGPPAPAAPVSGEDVRSTSPRAGTVGPEVPPPPLSAAPPDTQADPGDPAAGRGPLRSVPGTGSGPGTPVPPPAVPARLSAVPGPSPAGKQPEGRRELTEEEAAFMVLPLGIVPRQQDRSPEPAEPEPGDGDSQGA
jgi:hypothetical protein